MKLTYSIQGLCCATCAGKIEKQIQKIDGVKNTTLNLMLEKLKIEIEDNKEEMITPEVEKIIKKIEPDCSLKRR